MRYGWSGIAACVVLAMSSVSIVRADEPDLLTPKKAAVAFARAVVAGDMTAVRSLAIGTDAEYALVKSVSDLVRAFTKLEDVAVGRFGAEGKLPQGMVLDPVGDMETAEEKIDGDKATLILKSKPDDKNPPALRKTGDKWMIDLTSLSKDPQSAAMAAIVPVIVRTLEVVKKNIRENKYKTPADLYTDMSQQLAAALTPPADPAAK